MKPTKITVKVIKEFNDSENDFKEREIDEIIKDMPYGRYAYLKANGYVVEHKEKIKIEE